MSTETYGSLLIPIILQKMPREVTIQLVRKATEEIWPIKEILEIILREIEAREMGISVAAVEKKLPKQTVKPKQPQFTAQSFLAKGNQQQSKF